VADSTVIVQHVASVAIFICCFAGIFQERVSPITVVSVGSGATVIGWVLWDYWVTREDAATAITAAAKFEADADGNGEGSGTASSASSVRESQQGLGLGVMMGAESGTLTPRRRKGNHSHSTSATSTSSNTNRTTQGPASPLMTGHPTGAPNFANYSPYPPYGSTSDGLVVSPRNQQRLATVKSAILIYCALLGLSPILKSLTRSTSSDSIWALSTWLMCVNVFFFHYDGTPGAKYVSSLGYITHHTIHLYVHEKKQIREGSLD
jgi:phosphatidylinositol N-acetylglucosaminyltransferase subunit C